MKSGPCTLLSLVLPSLDLEFYFTNGSLFEPMHLSPTRASIKIENCTTLGVLPVSATRPRILSRQSFNRFWMKFIARALAREYCRVIYLVDKLPRLLSTK